MAPQTVEIAGIDGGSAALQRAPLSELGRGRGTRILFPEDEGFAAATRTWNGMVARTPALVAQPATPDAVAEIVRFAAEHDLLVSVRGGGHNIAGTAVAPGGLTIDMGSMRAVAVDPARRIARVQPGCVLGDVDTATQQHGLATVLGFVSETGVAGLTLGGGWGYLTRRFGWTVDNLEAVEIVTADGQVRTANKDSNPDLYWAVRGGSGNFGIVTQFSYRLHEVGPRITGGLIAWSAEQSRAVLQAYKDITSAAPRELTLALVVRHAPPAPFVPEAWRGKKIVAMIVCYTGDDPKRTLAPLRDLPTPSSTRWGRCRTPPCNRWSTPTSPRGPTGTGRPSSCPAWPTASWTRSARARCS